MLFIVLLLWITNLCAIDQTAIRDPFSFAMNMPQTNQSQPVKRKTQDDKVENKSVANSNDAISGWQVKKASDKAVILQSKDGAVREVSFEQQQKSD